MNSDDAIRSVQLKRYLYQKAAVNGIPITTNFELSPVCNFNCKMCYVRQSEAQVKNSPRPIMAVEEWIELAEAMKAQGTLYILLTGGEPFLWPDFWKLYERLYQMGFFISINSNGSLITDEVVARLQEMPPQQLNITLYGGCDETYKKLCGISGVYEKVTHAIKALTKARILVRLNGTITPFNVSDLEQMIEFAKEHRLYFKTTTYMFPPVRRDLSMQGRNHRFTPEEAAYYRIKIAKYQYDAKSYEKYLNDIVKGSVDLIDMEDGFDEPTGSIRCMAGKGSSWVTWDGYLSLCGMIPDFKVDLRKEGFDTAWEKLKKMGEEIHLSGTCHGCKNNNICHACAAMAYAENGTTENIPAYLCEMVREMREIAKRELNCI